MSSRIIPPASAKPCVVCGKPQAAAFQPFCSRRCADVDLHRWLAGAYALPATEDDEEDGPVASGRTGGGAGE
jgi:endogenous inhibitor of DNA gyrase (YacG/DUF329 family)